jgi:hypothetical protein
MSTCAIVGSPCRATTWMGRIFFWTVVSLPDEQGCFSHGVTDASPSIQTTFQKFQKNIAHSHRRQTTTTYSLTH